MKTKRVMEIVVMAMLMMVGLMGVAAKGDSHNWSAKYCSSCFKHCSAKYDPIIVWPCCSPMVTGHCVKCASSLQTNNEDANTMMLDKMILDGCKRSCSKTCMKNN
ncbi:hypothetical protein GIB67_020537 [Kingdonia uniflora]|uniref:Thionin-like protein 2 n=1 Tax=Kingdonia uniflora TaxID=39325 RepID=A0A7J7NL91_9MAGN|nr:hypothetical protein GIB67_020537 [Kingdonia uniflora]